MPSPPLNNFEIQKYYQNEPRFNGVYSRNNLPKIRDGVYVINRNEYNEYVNGNIVTYFDSFRVEHIPNEIRKSIGIKNITKNIFRTLAYHSIMCGYFCIRFIDFMLKSKNF